MVRVWGVGVRCGGGVRRRGAGEEWKGWARLDRLPYARLCLGLRFGHPLRHHSGCLGRGLRCVPLCSGNGPSSLFLDLLRSLFRSLHLGLCLSALLFRPLHRCARCGYLLLRCMEPLVVRPPRQLLVERRAVVC